MFTACQGVILRSTAANDHQIDANEKPRLSLRVLAIGCLGVMWLATTTFAGQIRYVDGNTTGAKDGSTWLDAFRFLQDALKVAEPGDQIWIAAGIYRPDQTASSPDGSRDRNATFQLKDGVAIHGGFPLGGGPWNARDVSFHATILNGDLDGNDGPDFTNNGQTILPSFSGHFLH